MQTLHSRITHIKYEKREVTFNSSFSLYFFYAILTPDDNNIKELIPKAGEHMMKVYLLKDVEKVGMAGEVIKVADGYGQNYLLPRKLGIEVTAANESFYKKKEKQIEHRKEVINSKTSMLAEKISSIKLTLKRKMHDDGKLYGAVAPSEIVEALAEKGVSVTKSQVEFNKSIKVKGNHEVIIKLSSSLKPTISVTIVPE